MAMVLMLAAPGVHAQQCATNGGTISTPVTDTCAVTEPGSTLTITGTGSLTGWVNFTGDNTALVLQSGASIVGRRCRPFPPWT